jgi:hypothetical protein
MLVFQWCLLPFSRWDQSASTFTFQFVFQWNHHWQVPIRLCFLLALVSKY